MRYDPVGFLPVEIAEGLVLFLDELVHLYPWSILVALESTVPGLSAVQILNVLERDLKVLELLRLLPSRLIPLLDDLVDYIEL